MADLHLKMTGDSHDAQDALHGAGDASKHAHDSMHELKEKLGELKESFTVGAIAADAFEKVLESVKEGLKESWEEAAKAENAQRQLAAAAGDLTKEFQEQAEAIGNAVARKSEDVEAMQTLLLRYGAAPDVIGKALVAAYDAAAQKGLEVNSVLNMMIRSAESNTSTIGRLGVSFKTTGDFSENLKNQIEALNGKFGGSAGIEADGMTGRARAASNALDEVKKSFGQLMGAFEEKLGLLQTVAMYFNALAQSGSVVSAQLGAGALALSKLQVGLGLGTAQGAKAIPDVEGTNKFAGGGVDVSVGEIETLAPTKKSIDQAAKNEEAYLNQYNKWQDEVWAAARKHEEADAKLEQEHDDAVLKRQLQAQDELFKAKEDAAKAWLEEQKKMDQMELEELKSMTRQQEEEVKTRERMWTSMGERVGNALVQGMISVFQGGNGGNGKPDFAAQLAGAIMGAVSAAIPLFGGLVSLIQKGFSGDFSGATGVGSQAMGFFKGSGTTGKDGQVGWTNYGGSDPSEWETPDFSGGSQHSGGWMKYHRGGWAGEVPAMLLAGERVLSHGEVARMGGRQGVDAAARGGGGGSLTVYAFDSESMLDTFAKKGGRAMLNTVRTGRGPMREMFGGS